MIITNNHVLVLPDENYTKDGEIELYDSFEPAKHFSVKGRVLAVPEMLICFREDMNVLRAMQRVSKNPIIQKDIQEMNRWSVEFDTDMEVRVGDDVVFRYINRIACVEDEQVFGRDELGSRGALLISYDELYMALRGDERILLNGWILVEPVEYSEAELIEMGGGFEKAMKSLEKPGVGIVREVGMPNYGYLDGTEEGPDVKPGMEILFRHSNAVPIEFKYHKELNEGKYAFYRMQRKDILAFR